MPPRWFCDPALILPLLADGLFNSADPLWSFASLLFGAPETSRFGSFVTFPASSLIFPFTLWIKPSALSFVLGFITISSPILPTTSSQDFIFVARGRLELSSEPCREPAVGRMAIRIFESIVTPIDFKGWGSQWS
jgi:hypothetical protein